MTYSTLQHHPKTPTTTLRTTKTPPQNTSYQQPRHHFSPPPPHPHRTPTQTPPNQLTPSSLYIVQGSKPQAAWFKVQGRFKAAGRLDQSSRFNGSRFNGSKFKVPPYTLRHTHQNINTYRAAINTSTHVAQPLTHQPMWQGHHHINTYRAATNTCGKPQNHHPPRPSENGILRHITMSRAAIATPLEPI